MEQLSTVRKDVESLRNEFAANSKSLTKERILVRLQNMALSLKKLEEKEKEIEKESEKEKEKKAEEKAKEVVEKGLSKKIKNVTENFDKIEKSEAELRKDANTSLDDIRVRNMMFTGFVSLLFGVQAGLNKEKWWTLFSLVISMALGSIWVIQKVGIELWGFRKKFRELSKKQNRYYAYGKVLIVDWKRCKDKDKFGDELKEEFAQLHKSIILDRKCVGSMGWTYLGNFIFFSVFSVTVPILLYFVLMAISGKDAMTHTHPPSLP